MVKKSNRYAFIKRIAMCAILILFIFVGSPFVYGAEILFEQNWQRIVSGDWATRITREIAEEPVPTKVYESALVKIFDSLQQPKPTREQLQAWQEGLEKFGWAQQETEPEHDSYQAMQIIAVDSHNPKLIARQSNLLGKIAELQCDVAGKKLTNEHFAIPEDLDRTVFHTIKNPALFVLNQEHFQKHFFEGMLNLDYPGLERVKQAYHDKKTLLAAHEVAEYFRRKTHSVWAMTKPQAIRPIEDEAEKVLRHEFKYHDQIIRFEDRVDWYNNPTDDSEWLWYINRMHHWVTLLTGYLQTSNEAYAQEFNAEALDWVVRNPAPAFRLTRVPAWRNLEAGIRGSSTWPKSFFGFLASPSFQTHTIQLMLASLWSHAEHITRFPSGMRFVNNWVITESSGLAIIGMSFPEFRNAEEWASVGLNRLAVQLAKQVYADGMQHELAAGYHISCLHSFQNAFDVALKTQTPVPENYSATLERMYEYLMYVCTPARETPPTNDSNRNNVIDWLLKGADQFDRDDMRYVATFGKEGKPPQETSHQFPWGGQCVMRSDWSKNAMALFFDAGPFGISHQHEDKLHIDVSAFGRDFITDGGKGLYVPDKWRDYFISTAAHNTIMIDGQGQRRVDRLETHPAQQPLTDNWYSDERVDYAYGVYQSGYGMKHIPVTHSRQVLFKKNEYWLVIDYLTGDGSHEFDLIYHFSPCDLKLNPASNSALTNFADGKNLFLIAESTLPVSAKVVTGQENPEQGWIYTSEGRTPSPTLIYHGDAELPVVLVTLIMPFRHKRPTLAISLSIAALPQAFIIISNKGVDDHWVVNLHNKKSITHNGKSLERRFAFYRIE